MTNKYFPEEEIKKNDLYFICYMVERVARKLHQKNSYIVNKIEKEELEHLISVANVLHAENPEAVEDEWIHEYALTSGEMDVEVVDKELVDKIPSTTQMGKVYSRLSRKCGRDGASVMYSENNSTLCEKLDTRQEDLFDGRTSTIHEYIYIVS